MEIGVIGNDMFTVGFRAVGIEKWFKDGLVEEFEAVLRDGVE